MSNILQFYGAAMLQLLKDPCQFFFLVSISFEDEPYLVFSNVKILVSDSRSHFSAVGGTVLDIEESDHRPGHIHRKCFLSICLSFIVSQVRTVENKIIIPVRCKCEHGRMRQTGMCPSLDLRSAYSLAVKGCSDCSLKKICIEAEVSYCNICRARPVLISAV